MASTATAQPARVRGAGFTGEAAGRIATVGEGAAARDVIRKRSEI